jgi:hypothetical protein
VTLIPLTAGFVASRMKTRARWKPWRGWVWASVAIGSGVTLLAYEPARLFPILRSVGVSGQTLARFDPLARLRGWEMLGQRVGAELQALGPDAIVLCDHYQQTALMAFYVPDRPRTFHAGLYFTGAQRMNQYALWPEMRLDRPDLVGRNAVYVGKGGPMPEPLPGAFDRVERLPDIPVSAGGVVVETFKVWRCWNFKGLKRPDTARSY